MKASAYGYKLSVLQKNHPSNTYWIFVHVDERHPLHHCKVKVIGHKPEDGKLWIEDETGERHLIYPMYLKSKWIEVVL